MPRWLRFHDLPSLKRLVLRLVVCAGWLWLIPLAVVWFHALGWLYVAAFHNVYTALPRHNVLEPYVAQTEPGLADGQATCTHYASPSGGGNGLSQSTPFQINNFWSVSSLPGKVLCLNNGTYTGTNSMITPPSGIKGTSGSPITIRALNDGQVLIDAQGGQAVTLAWNGGGANDNAWFVIDGINAKNGGQDGLYRVSGSDNILQRVIGWDGTSGASDANIFRITGYRSRAVDCAGWGMNSRKIFDGAQAGDLDGAGFKRCWGEWNDHTGATGQNPNDTLQVGYNTTNQLFENMVLTSDVLGQVAEPDGLISLFHNATQNPNSVAGTKILGNILYYDTGTTPHSEDQLHAGGISDVYLEDLVMFIHPTFGSSYFPAWFINCGSVSCVNNVCQNCLSVHAGTPILNNNGSGFTTPGLRQGNGLASATGGTSPFVLLPGICKRYENGTLTSTPLWPWPMNQRIRDARAAGGYRDVDVTATIERLLGTIPAACRSDVGGDTTPPTVAMTAPTTGATVSGSAVVVTASASDNVAIVGVQFRVDGINVGNEQCCVLSTLWDSTSVANGTHTLDAVARDAAGNITVSTSITVTVTGAMSPAVTVSPTTVERGGSVTATWAGIPTPNPYDWIGLYLPGAANNLYLAYQYIDPTHVAGVASGSMAFLIPDDPFAAGTYELRLFNTDMLTNLLDISETFTVTNAVTGGLTFLGEGTGLSVTGTSTITFLGEGTGLSVTGNSTITFLGEGTGLSVTGTSTITFLGEGTGLSVQ